MQLIWFIVLIRKWLRNTPNWLRNTPNKARLQSSVAYTISEKGIRFRHPDYDPDRAQRPCPDICRQAKFHPNPCTHFCVILLTDRQTDKCRQSHLPPPSSEVITWIILKQKRCWWLSTGRVFVTQFVDSIRNTVCGVRLRPVYSDTTHLISARRRVELSCVGEVSIATPTQLNSTDLLRADWLYASTGSVALPIVGDSWVASVRVSIATQLNWTLSLFLVIFTFDLGFLLINRSLFVCVCSCSNCNCCVLGWLSSNREHDSLLSASPFSISP